MQDQSWLEHGNGVGKIWLDLVDAGYNAYLSADGTEWNGVFNYNGTGEGFDEISDELTNGLTTGGDHITRMGLVAYSHGAGIARRLSDQIFNNRTSTAQQLVFAGTIDGVVRDTIDWSYPSPLDQSPGGLDVGWNARCSNWYQTHDFLTGWTDPNLQILPVHGQYMNDVVAADNHLLQTRADGSTPSRHVEIYNDLRVIGGIEGDLANTFGRPQINHIPAAGDF